ncbi:MAG: hypothetical protein EOP06_18115 [Proteobacteria bacterium]|nr:MAG: hypothetical protein EOP06_18115 [Pseudomonadota bacterium]
MKDKEILGREIGSGYSQKITKEMQPNIEKVWNLTEGNSNFFFGVIQYAVDHKDFIYFKDKFEKVGTLKVFDGLKKMGSFGYADFDRFEEIFSDLENHIKIFRQKKYPVIALCEI